LFCGVGSALEDGCGRCDSNTPSMFESICERVTARQFAGVVVVINRVLTIQSAFFEELSSVSFDTVTAFQESVYTVDYCNIQFENITHPNTSQFVNMIARCGP
jgi:hypothetical protein